MNPGDMLFATRRGDLLFAAPEDVAIARDLGGVRRCLAHAAAAVARGRYAAGFLAYEAAGAFDPALRTHAPGPLPLAWFGLYKNPPLAGPGPGRPDGRYQVGPWTPLLPAGAYRAAIERIRDLIVAGDTYQVNYTFPLQAAFRGDTLAWFRCLCRAQQADFCAYVDTGRFRLLSASPELFFRLGGGAIETRPMKGTAHRGRWPEEDRRAAADLAASEKERAENVMIVDLLRNDLGRVSATGSVSVNSLFDVERYPTVWQMTSTIVSRTAAGVPEILAALFPSGSVTGAPKIRAMSIIRELEPHPRGAYCGTIGWWEPGGRAEFNVAIRTVTVDTEIGMARYPVGGGITYGSSPDAEYAECLDKAAVLTQPAPDFELLETLRYDADGVFLREGHLDRLAASAEYFGFPFDRAAAAAALDTAVQPLAAGRSGPPAAFKIRLRLDRNGAIHIDSEPLRALPSPLRVGLAPHPVEAGDVRLFHKTTARAVYEAARAARPDCDDVLLWNTRGEITESTIANLVVERDGQKTTPPLEAGLLGGVFRRRLLEDGAIREGPIRRADLAGRRSFYLINSVRQWMDAQWVDG